MERWRQATDPRTALSPSLDALSPLQTAQARDIAGWLPNDLLLKLDRCLMAHGMEGRTPFLDPEVARFGFFLPDKFKVRGRLGKWVLRRWLARHCPGAEPFARKSGFTTPVGAWIAPRAAQLGPRIAEVEGVRRFCDAQACVRSSATTVTPSTAGRCCSSPSGGASTSSGMDPAEALSRLD